MEKKAYIKPSMEATEIEAQVMMAGSVVGISNTTTDDDAKMAGERRGSWGNRWE